jgi:hypothetical protein
MRNRLIDLALAVGLSVVPATAFAREIVECMDGTTAFQGDAACLDHGGPAGPKAAPLTQDAPAVTEPERPPPIAADPASANAPVRCRDGVITAAPAERACARHGGLAPITPLADPAPYPRPLRR